MKSLLRQKKLSETPFRLEVLEILEHSRSAVSISFIEKNLKDYNRVTLYRTIKTFVKKGIIHQIAMSDGDLSYALCKETCVEKTHSHDHVHLKCKECEDVFCVEIGGLPTINLGNHQMDSMEIQAIGTCESCLAS